MWPKTKIKEQSYSWLAMYSGIISGRRILRDAGDRIQVCCMNSKCPTANTPALETGAISVLGNMTYIGQGKQGLEVPILCP